MESVVERNIAGASIAAGSGSPSPTRASLPAACSSSLFGATPLVLAMSPALDRSAIVVAVANERSL